MSLINFLFVLFYCDEGDVEARVDEERWGDFETVMEIFAVEKSVKPQTLIWVITFQFNYSAIALL